MILQRKEAVRLAAFIQMFRLPAKQREFFIESALLENEAENISEAKEHFYLRDYIEYELKFVKNSYLGKLISDKFNVKVIIEGKQPRLFRCRCCGYKTLKQIGHFDICKICFWEDDGADDDERYSPPNRMTLKEARNNFEMYGACDEKSLQHLNEDRMLKYEK